MILQIELPPDIKFRGEKYPYRLGDKHKEFPQYFDKFDKPKNKYYQDLALLKLDLDRDVERVAMNVHQIKIRQGQLLANYSGKYNAPVNPQQISELYMKTLVIFDSFIDEPYTWENIRIRSEYFRKWSSDYLRKVCEDFVVFKNTH